MGWAERRSRRLWRLMRGLEWWNRLRVFVAFGNVERRPRPLRGRQGLWWLLTGHRRSARNSR
jgi:hypothetical protein